MAIQIASEQIQNSAITNDKLAGSISSAKLDLTGTYNFNSGVLRAASPSADADVAIKSYVDSVAAGAVFWKVPVKVASTANINLSNALINGASIDGVTVQTGDRVLVKNQSSAAENGIYDVVASGAANRSLDTDSAQELNGAAVFVKDGGNADQGYVQTATISTIGSDTVTWVQFTGLGQITAGSALTKSANTLNVAVDDSSIQIVSDALQLKDSGVTNAKLAGSISADKLAGSIGDSLLNTISTGNKVSGSAVQLAGSGGLENNSGLKISAGGVTDAMLAGSIADGKLSTITSGNKVSGSAVQLAGGGGLEDSSGLQISANGVETSMVGDNQITAAKLSGSIPDSKLNTITSGNKVSGSAVQLKSGGGLEDSSGLSISANGVETSMVGDSQITAAKLSGSIPDSKLNTITTGNKVSGSAVQLAGSGGLEDSSGLKISAGGVSSAMLAGSIATSKLSLSSEVEALSPNGSTLSFDLSSPLSTNLAFILVFRNGLAVKQVMSSPSGTDQFTVSPTGGAGGNARITFGSNIPASDDLRAFYLK